MGLTTIAAVCIGNQVHYYANYCIITAQICATFPNTTIQSFAASNGIATHHLRWVIASLHNDVTPVLLLGFQHRRFITFCLWLSPNAATPQKSVSHVTARIDHHAFGLWLGTNRKSKYYVRVGSAHELRALHHAAFAWHTTVSNHCRWCLGHPTVHRHQQCIIISIIIASPSAPAPKRQCARAHANPQKHTSTTAHPSLVPYRPPYPMIFGSVIAHVILVFAANKHIVKPCIWVP